MKKLWLTLAVFSTLFSVSMTAAPAYAGQASSTCGTTKTQLISCSGTTGVGTIAELIKMTVNILTVLIGIVAVGALAYAGILYATAQDDQGKVNGAKTMIRNVVIGLLLYGFTIAIINWLIPGGVIG